MANIISVISSNTKPGPKRDDPNIPKVYIVKVDQVPTVSPGTEAPLGTLAIFEQNGTARKFFKTGLGNFDWEEETGLQAQIDDLIAEEPNLPRTYRDTFTSDDLTLNTLTVTHSLGNTGVMFQIYDENDEGYFQDNLLIINSTDSNTLSITFPADTVTGTWTIVVIG